MIIGEKMVSLALAQSGREDPSGVNPEHVFANDKTFLNQCVASLMRDRFRLKRDARRARSLNKKIGRADGAELGDTLCCRHGNDQKIADLGMDIDETIAQLTRDQKQLCEVLGVTSVSELARRFEMPRTTLSDRVGKVRHVFEDRGMRDYLK